VSGSGNVVALCGSLSAVNDRAEAQRDLDMLRAILRRRVFESRDHATVGIGFLTEGEAAECLRLVGKVRRHRRRRPT
jgi:hypothetical protein